MTRVTRVTRVTWMTRVTRISRMTRLREEWMGICYYLVYTKTVDSVFRVL